MTTGLLITVVPALLACGSDQSDSQGAKPTEVVRHIAEQGATPTLIPRTQDYTPVSIGEIKQFDDIPPPMEPSEESGFVNHDARLKLVSRHVPSFGGMYSANGGTLVVILNDETQLDRAVAAIAAYFGPDTITDPLFVERGGYTVAELTEWYRIAQDIVWQIDGVFMSDLDEGNGRIDYGVVTEKTAEKVRAALEGTGIPPGAVKLDVRPLQILENFKPNQRSPLGIELSFESPVEISVGEPAEFATTLTNRGNLRVIVCISRQHKENVIVFKDGIEVWSTHGRSGNGLIPVCDSVELSPGESKTLESIWSLVDNDLEPVGTGVYTVGVSIGFSEDSDGLGSGASLRSKLQELTFRKD